MPEKKLQVARTPAYDSSQVVYSKSYTQPPKKAQVAPVPVKTSSVPVGIQSNVPPPTGIEVVHIPAKRDFKIGIFFLPTTLIKHNDHLALNTHTKNSEKRIKQVPDLRCYTDTFRWDSRSLFEMNISGDGVPDSCKGTYPVYKCEDESKGLPENEHFEHIPGVCAYGDVFVFRIKKLGHGTSGKIEYGSMESGFLQNYYEHGTAKALLYTAAKIYDFEEREEKLQVKKKKGSGADASEAS